MALSSSQVRRVIAAARALSIVAPAQYVEDFIAPVLGLNPMEVADYFPQPDPEGEIAKAVAHLSREREIILRDECAIPEFAVFLDPVGGERWQIAGFNTYLVSRGFDASFTNRLRHHRDIRAALRRLRQGRQLELLAAAVMNASVDYGEATKASGDQGIDAVGWHELIFIHPSFLEGSSSEARVFPGEKVFLFGSSKAVAAQAKPRRLPRLINPAHIRELIGGWLIQRTAVGMWQGVGIRMLTPVQMILVTTYRLSVEAKALCLELGVQVWGIPELIFLICKSAPTAVFDAANLSQFSSPGFRDWWRERQQPTQKAA